MLFPLFLLIKPCAVLSHSLQLHGLQPTRLLCPWEFSKQENWSGLPCLPPGDLPKSGIEPGSPTLQADSLLSEPPVKPMIKPCLSYKTGVGKLQQGDQIWLPSFL